MEYRTLGNTGLSVSAIALGCEGFVGKTEEQTCAEMDFAISKGINFIDMYASNPDLRSNIGKALTGRREQFIIQGHLCTTWENDQYLRTRDIDKAIASFEDQLARLDTDYLDIGMIHYVDSEEDFHEIFHESLLHCPHSVSCRYPDSRYRGVPTGLRRRRLPCRCRVYADIGRFPRWCTDVLG